MIIFGITGTLGAGKGTVVDYLIEKHCFVHYSVRGFLTQEIKKREMKLNRDSMVELANELRAKHHPAYIIEQLYNQAKSSDKNCIIESIRTPGEVDHLRQMDNFYLLAVDADPEVRYDRITDRKSETDQISFKEFVSNEEREMTSNDPNKQNLSSCIKQADFQLMNNTNFEEFYMQVEVTLQKIKFYD